MKKNGNHVTVSTVQDRYVSILICLLFLSVFGTGCGSVLSKISLDDALVAVERARASGADEHAPYEYYKARYYLYKAEEEWGRSNYAAANDFAVTSKKSAEIATIKAKEDPWNGSPGDPKVTPESMADDGRTNKMLGVEK